MTLVNENKADSFDLCLKMEHFSDNKCIPNGTFLIAFSLHSQM